MKDCPCSWCKLHGSNECRVLQIDVERIFKVIMQNPYDTQLDLAKAIAKELEAK